MSFCISRSSLSLFRFFNMFNVMHKPNIQCLSRKKHTSIEDPIVITDDGAIFVCWHPEKEFPYDFTKSMDELPAVNPSVLRMSKKEAMTVLGKKKPVQDVREELAKITYTCIHRWYPKGRRHKIARKPARDREYL